VINPVVTDPSWSATGGIPVAFRATDTNGSGIAATYYTIDGGARQTYGEPFTAELSDGTHTITYWSVDIAGNVEMKDSETFKTVVVNVDTQAPTVTRATSTTPSGATSRCRRPSPPLTRAPTWPTRTTRASYSPLLLSRLRMARPWYPPP
jgi:hypothetical protein